MADKIVQLEDLDVLFADFVQKCLDLNDEQVLISYQERGQIFPRIGNDTVFVKVYQEQDERLNYKYRNREYSKTQDKITTVQYAMRTLRLHLVFYGPNCEVNAQKLNECLYFDSTKQFLYNNNLSLIPDLTDFNDIGYEKINEQWWRRSDLKVRFYNSVSVEEKVDTIESTDIHFEYSDITIITDKE